MVDKFTYRVLVSDINPVANVTWKGSIEKNTFNFDLEERKGSKETACHSGFKKEKVSRDGTKKGSHSKIIDSAKLPFKTPK